MLAGVFSGRSALVIRAYYKDGNNLQFRVGNVCASCGVPLPTFTSAWRISAARHRRRPPHRLRQFSNIGRNAPGSLTGTPSTLHHAYRARSETTDIKGKLSVGPPTGHRSMHALATPLRGLRLHGETSEPARLLRFMPVRTGIRPLIAATKRPVTKAEAIADVKSH
jgi:hypothetical protein